jgi:hypothetical protein
MAARVDGSRVTAAAPALAGLPAHSAAGKRGTAARWLTPPCDRRRRAVPRREQKPRTAAPRAARDAPVADGDAQLIDRSRVSRAIAASLASPAPLA